MKPFGGIPGEGNVIEDNHLFYRVADTPNDSIEILNPPECLYRYHPEEYADGFLRGRIGVDLISSYRESKHPILEDPNEGLHEVPLSRADGLPEYGLPIDSDCVFTGNQLGRMDGESYCLCFSTARDHALLKRFTTASERVCIAIRKPKVFLSALDRAVRTALATANEPVIRARAGHVTYYEAGAGMPSPKQDLRLWKRRHQFGVEKEYRAFWSVGGWSPAQSMFVAEIDEQIAADCCEVVTVD